MKIDTGPKDPYSRYRPDDGYTPKVENILEMSSHRRPSLHRSRLSGSGVFHTTVGALNISDDEDEEEDSDDGDRMGRDDDDDDELD